MTIRVQPPAGNSQETSRIARLLVEAADDPGDVVAVSDGPSLGFLVPETVAAKVKFNEDTELTDDKGDKVSADTETKKKASKKGNA